MVFIILRFSASDSLPYNARRIKAEYDIPYLFYRITADLSTVFFNKHAEFADYLTE